MCPGPFANALKSVFSTCLILLIFNDGITAVWPLAQYFVRKTRNEHPHGDVCNVYPFPESFLLEQESLIPQENCPHYGSE